MKFFYLAYLAFPLLLAACDQRASMPVQNSAKTESIPMPADLPKTEAEWKKILTPEQYLVLRQKGTERPFTGPYDNQFQKGTYVCAACGQELFTSETKFNSGCGWPAFYAAKAGDRVQLTPDLSFGAARTEVTCSRCGSHLGHVFNQETHTIEGQEKVVDRYCINSVALKFIPAPASPPK